MTYITNHRWLALLACVAMLPFLFGCHGGDIFSLIYGSWNGDKVELYSSALQFGCTLEEVTLALEKYAKKGSAVGTAEADDHAELWANVDDEGPIHYVGTFVQDGNNMTATLVPEVVNGTQVGVDSMCLNLKIDSAIKMSGTLTWLRGDEEFAGPATFDKYPDD